MANDALFTANNLWLLMATALVFIMHMGFAAIESGLTQSKNTVNILFKNTMIVCMGILAYYLVGFGLMYPGGEPGGWFGFAQFGLQLPEGPSIEYNAGQYTYYTDFIFQAMFAATCATIVSGAVAGRIKIQSFLIFSLLFVSLCYPITGMWKWGYGWLDELGFHDFAGSTLVHSVGGWGALASIMLLGARRGKYENGHSKLMPGHSMPLAAFGVFLLWFGWYGFNGGSVLSADPDGVSLVFVTTTLAAAAGGMGAFLSGWLKFKIHDITMAFNGILGGLVGVTAGADVFGPNDALIVGFVAGFIVPHAVIFIDKTLKLDDPVGATSVHLVCGIWGTLAVGLFGSKAGGEQVLKQLTGIGAVGLFAFVFAFVLMWLLKKSIGLRVSAEEEKQGLDIFEHGMHAYDMN